MNKKIVIKQDLKHEDYKNKLFNNEQMFHKMKTIRSNHHHLGSHELNKVSLSYQLSWKCKLAIVMSIKLSESL